MIQESIKGLEFMNFVELPDFEERLTEFLNSLDEELKTWRDYVRNNGRLSIPHRITGIACLDGEKIVGIAYFFVPKRLRIQYLINLFLGRASPKEAETGAVVKKVYQRRGIYRYITNLRTELMRKMDYGRVRYSTDSDNIAVLKLAVKKGHKIVKRTDNRIYFVYDLNDDERE